MRFVPYEQLEGVPNIVVDGSGTDSTVLVLSHWPRSGSPGWAKADLSAQMAFRYLDHPQHHVAADAVSNNHFDQDGLVSVLTLLDPAAANSRRERLIDVAAAGDFGTFRDRDAARVAMAIAAYDDLTLSPAATELAGLAYPDMAARLYEMLLPRLIEMVDDPDAYRSLWADEDARLGASLAAIADGTVSIEERRELDLAIVTIPERGPATTADEGRLHRFTQALDAPIHPFAVNNATDQLRIVLRHGRRYDVEFRYESWVQLVSRRPLPRVDLAPLAERLNQDEHADGAWRFSGVGALTPTLRLHGADESSIDWPVFRALLEQALAEGAPAWDPYDDPA